MIKLEITLFDDTQLNPNIRVVNNIIRAVGKNNGYCPCVIAGLQTEDTKCPCRAYIQNRDCKCTLYIKK